MVSTNAPGALVRIDGRPGNAIDQTVWRFERVPLGDRHAVLTHRDFVPRETVLGVGLFGDGRYQVEMERRRIRLTVNALPGAEVFLDGQSFGKVSESGVFFSEQVPAGDYSVSVRLAGYEEWHSQAALHNDETSLRVTLRMTPERRAEIARQRDRAFELMQDAATMFAKRNYKAALAAIEESLKLFPDDFRAQQLRDRIVETMRILQ